MRVSILMENKDGVVFTTGSDCPVLECVQKMNDRRVGALVIIAENDSVEGIITDILRAIGQYKEAFNELTVRDIMTRKDKLLTATRDDSIENIMEVMTNNRIRHLPVVEGGKLMGIISIGDVVKSQLETALMENESMRNYIAGA